MRKKKELTQYHKYDKYGKRLQHTIDKASTVTPTKTSLYYQIRQVSGLSQPHTIQQYQSTTFNGRFKDKLRTACANTGTIINSHCATKADCCHRTTTNNPTVSTRTPTQTQYGNSQSVITQTDRIDKMISKRHQIRHASGQHALESSTLTATKTIFALRSAQVN